MMFKFSKGFKNFVRGEYGDQYFEGEKLVSGRLRALIYGKLGYTLEMREKYSLTPYKCLHLSVGESILWPAQRDCGTRVAIPRILNTKKEQVAHLGWEFDMAQHDSEHYKITRYK